MDEQSPARPELKRLGGYLIESLLARGGMGEVYLAFDERLHRHIAIKRIRGDVLLDERRRARFRREALAVARLSHPAVVQIHDILDTEDGDCLVMEYVAGSSLRQLCNGRPLELPLALRLASEIADGLAEAHSKGLIHRDLKSENVIVTPSGHAKILDFGLARWMWDEDQDRGSLTEAGALVGTGHAMSPEQASGRTVDYRSDLFAFGVLLYEMLTGRSPFLGATLLETLKRVTGESPRPIGELRLEVPPTLAELIERLLAKDPGNRPPSIRLVAIELTRLVGALAASATPLVDPVEPALGVARGEFETPPTTDPDDLLTASAVRDPLDLGWRPQAGQTTPRRDAWRSEGGDLPTWAERQGGLAKVPLETRLELVAEVAEALAAAHSVGVLHKDVKPANVLIAPDRGGHPHVRLSDFGIGLLTDPGRLSAVGIAALGFTDTAVGGSDTGGTLRYLAPELIEGKPPTIQSDIYSLGVMLYQVVVGDFSRVLAPGWHREIDDELLCDDIALFVDGAAARRPASAAEVATRLRGLEERRQRIADDRRARRQELHTARALEHVRRRRRWLAGLATATAAVLLVVAMFALRAERARRHTDEALRDAERRRAQAEGLIGFMLGDLRRQLKPIGRLAILSEVGEEALEYFAAVPEEDLSDEELRHRARAFYQIGSVHLELGDFPAAGGAFRAALDLARDRIEGGSDDSEWQFELGQSLFWVGNYFYQERDFDRAWEHFQGYLEIAEKLAAQDPGRDDWQLELAYAHSNLASVLDARGESAAALVELAPSVAVLEGLLERQPDNAMWRLELSHVLSKIGSLRKAEGDLAGATRSFQATLEIRQRLAERDPDDADLRRYLATVHNHLGDLLEDLGQPHRALEHYRADLELAEILAGQDQENTTAQRELAVSHKEVGRLCQTLGDLELAGEHVRIAVKLSRKLVERDPEHTTWRLEAASSHQAFASLHLAAGSPQRALEEVDEAMGLLESIVRSAHEDTRARWLWSQTLWLLGQVRDTLGEASAARDAWGRAAEVIEPLARENRDVRLLEAWVLPLLALDRLAQARPIAEKLYAQGFREPRFLELCRAKGVCPRAG